MSSIYRVWVDRLDNYSVGQKLFLFEFVFFLSGLVPAAAVAQLQTALGHDLPFPHPFPFPGDLLGIPVVVVAVAVDIWSIGTFLTIGAGTPAPMKPPVKVVSDGHYKYVRNPMYLDVFLTALGLAVLFD